MEPSAASSVPKLAVPHAPRVLQDMENLFQRSVEEYLQSAALGREDAARVQAELASMKYSVFTSARRFITNDAEKAPEVVQERFNAALETRVQQLHSRAMAGCGAPPAAPTLDDAASADAENLQAKAALLAAELTETKGLLAEQAVAVEREVKATSDAVKAATTLLR